MVVIGGGAVSYERGTPVTLAREKRVPGVVGQFHLDKNFREKNRLNEQNLHTWIILGVAKHRLVQIGRKHGPTE